MDDITHTDIKVIAHIRTDLPEKFGIPRQSGLAPNLKGTIIFEPEYRNPDAVRGLEEFNYIWLIWQFEGTQRESWSPTVRPPRLGGNTHVGVFATRSPFRPNSIGLSSVKLDEVQYTSDKGPLLHVSGIDLKDNTPIYDIKPYLHYADSHEDAVDGFAGDTKDYALKVDFPKELLEKIPEEKRSGIIQILSQDPRPSYHDDAERRYGVAYAGMNVRFTVRDGVASVFDVTQSM
jgi:tRNA-Thr(GGU) m(6)t(6)A37 methyltransferase TsaA